MTEETTKESGAEVHGEMDDVPTFEPTRPLKTWDSPEGPTTGVEYDGGEQIMERDDHVAYVEAVMARDQKVT